jgi:TonB family protein
VQTALAHGRALEAVGNRAAALAAYREASAASVSASDRGAATLGIARALLPDDPGAAGAEVAELAEGPPTPERWSARFIIAAASSLQGKPETADSFADEAWADAGNAPLHDLAPLHVAVLRAGLAAARHDLTAERAMLTAANGLSVYENSGLAVQLPVCGTAGVRPSDFVIFGYISGPFAIRQLVPISASRPEIVRSFQDALGLAPPVKASAGPEKPFGTVFTVACRTLVSPGIMTTPAPENPIMEWFVERGLYPVSPTNESDDKHLNAVANRVDALVAKYGTDNPLLIYPRVQLMQLLEARAAEGDPVVLGQITDLSSQVAAGLRNNGAPEWMAATIEAGTQMMQVATPGERLSTALQRAQSVAERPIREMPPELARRFIGQMTGDLPDDWPASAAQFVTDLSAKITPALSGIERQSWLLTVAKAQSSLGKSREAKATLDSALLAPDLCVRLDQPPKLVEQQFSYEDYPQELLSGDQEGTVLYDFDLTRSGSVGAHRIVYSVPSGIFDRASDKGLSTVRYSVPRRNGTPTSCRGIYQPIVWRIAPTAKPPTLRVMPNIDKSTT